MMSNAITNWISKPGRRRLVSLLAGLLAASAQQGQAAPSAHLYRYADGANGQRTYTNVPRLARDRPLAADAARSQAPAVVRRSDAAPVPDSKPASRAGPGEFPLISRQEQARRDRDRLFILQDEMAHELSAYQLAVSAGSPAQVVHRHKVNIDALTRELARLD